MKIQLELDIEIETPDQDPDRVVRPKYRGDPDIIAFLKAQLSESYGFYGHSFNPDRATNLDLWAAIIKIEWEVQEVDRAPLPRSDFPPENAVS